MWGQDTDYSGKYYIASDAIVNSKSTYDANTPANNYYLCPTDGWCYYKATDEYDADGTTYPNPFLTTFKWRDGVNDNKVIWIIEKCPNSNYSNYYYIKQHIEGNRYKYLMLNGKISGGATINRMRVHLEEYVEDTDHPTDNALFSITLASSANVPSLANAKSVIITPKNTEGEEGKRKYLVVNGGNANALTGQSGKEGGPGAYKNTLGIIGLYFDENNKQDANAPFYLENNPTITYSNKKIRITYFDYADDEVEIRYTDDGTQPTASSKLYEGEFDPDDGVTTIKAIAIKDEKVSDVATFSPPFFLGSTHNYLIQSKNCKFYNMIPNVSVDDNTKYVSTLNVPCSTMAWHFEDAEEGYYYIVDANGWYMYYTTTENTNKYIYLKSNKDDSDGFKFKIASHKNGGYNIIPKGSEKAIYKNIFGNNNAGLIPVKFDGTITEAVARWDIIPYSNLTQWDDQPFTKSTDNDTKYYKIVSVREPTKPLILAKNENNEEVIMSTTLPESDYDNRKSMWVIKKVGTDTDGLLDFYTFQNAYTGEMLYLNKKKKEVKTDTGPGMVQMGQPTEDGADATWSHFVIVQTINNGYNIIPRVLVDNTKAISTGTTHEGFNCINRANGSDVTGTWYDNDDGSRWTFALQENVKCMNPVFTEEENGDITITSVTNGAKIRYTDDGTDPTEGSAEYTTKEKTSAQKIIKAIAIMGNDASTASNVVTLLNKPDITLAAGPYTYKGTAWEPEITKVSITLSGTEIEADASAYSVTSASYTNNINAGTDAATVTLTDANAIDLWYIWNASTTFSIDKATLTITPDENLSKVYGEENPTLTYTPSVPYGDDVFDGALGRAEGENVGSYAINQGTLKITRESADVSDNYVITIADKSFAITARPITISGITASEKTYDGNTTASLVYTDVTYGNIKDDDELTVTATGTFDDKNVGTGKTVTISDLALGGTDAANYTLAAASEQQKEATAGINPKPLTITNVVFTANNKPYDGTTDAVFGSIDSEHATIEGVIAGDDLTIVSATGSFDDKNVGTGKTVIITGFTFGGTDAANYTYTGGDLTTTADITPASVTVTAENKTKGYGDDDPELTWTVAGLKGTDTKDVLTVSMSRTEGEDVGTTITITPSGDTEQGNYTVSYVTGTLTITAKAIGDGTTPAEGIDIDITYDGTDYTVTVKQGENELQQGEDKAYTWTGADGSTDTYVVTITGQGNYNNSAKATYIKQTFYDTTPDQVFTPEKTAAVYCASQNLKVNDTFEAYYVTKLENNTLTITKVEAGEGENKKNYIPEGLPVLLISETNPAPKGFTLKPYTGTDLVTIPTTGEGANLLKVVPDEGGRAVNLEEVYIFSMGEFVLNKAGTMSKGKFYLENPDYNTSAHSRSILSITSGDVTGIHTSQLSDTDSQIPDIWYTIGGQKLHKKPTRKGIYLHNGKKVVIK